MGVHVDEIHTRGQLRRAAATEPGAGGRTRRRPAEAAPARPGAAEETWRRTMARVTQLGCAGCAAEGFDD